MSRMSFDFVDTAPSNPVPATDDAKGPGWRTTKRFGCKDAGVVGGEIVKPVAAAWRPFNAAEEFLAILWRSLGAA